MRRDLERRLSRLEQMLFQPRACTLIRVRGGIPGEELTHASAGALRFQRQPGELQELFESRVLEAAEEAGEPFAIIGGLRDGNLQ